MNKNKNMNKILNEYNISDLKDISNEIINEIKIKVNYKFNKKQLIQFIIDNKDIYYSIGYAIDDDIDDESEDENLMNLLDITRKDLKDKQTMQNFKKLQQGLQKNNKN
jgi:hypothetical protein